MQTTPSAYRLTNTTPYQWSANSNDLADQQFTERIARIGNAFKNRINEHADIKAFIYQQAKANSSHAVSFNDIITTFPEFRNLINEQLGMLRSDDPLQDIEDSLVYNGITYYPEIYIPNIDVADLTLTPAIAIGTTVENNEAPGWVWQDNAYADALLSESFLTSTTSLMVTDNNTDWHSVADVCYGDSLASGNENQKDAAVNSTQDYHWKEMKIKVGYRFDSDNTSEIRLTRSCFGESNNTVILPNEDVWGDIVNNCQSIINESSGDIDNSILLYIDNSVTGISGSEFYAVYPYVFITWFEYDWINTKKHMYCYPLPGSSLVNDYKTKYADDYYIGICTFNQVTSIVNVGNYYTWDNHKSYFKDTRTN